MKRFTKKELEQRKEELTINAYAYYMLNGGYKVMDKNEEIIGYITIDQFIKLNTLIIKYNYGYKKYKIV